jgi:folate-binding protein YgfZ
VLTLPDELAGHAGNLRATRLLVAPRSISSDLAAALEQAGIPAADAEARRVAAGLPAFGAEMGIPDAANPHELGLQRLVDGAKGCYVGQEVVARLETYDKVQRSLVLIRAATELRQGDQLRPTASLRGRPGRVTTGTPPSSAEHHRRTPPDNGSLVALALVPRGVQPGDTLTITREGSPVGEGIVERVMSG